MNKQQIIIGVSVIIIIFAIFGIIFTFQDRAEVSNSPAENIPAEQSFDFVKEDTSSSPTEYFESFGLNKLKINVYGGPKDIKTVIKNNVEYSLIRNPKSIGGLEFVSSDEFGEYYFAQDSAGENIIFTPGDASGRFGYGDVGEVSGVPIRERIPSAEYYAAYPTSELALKSGFTIVENTGVANRFLSTKYLKIKNLTNNKEVVVEIDSRNPIENTLMISEAGRIALGLDNNALGSFELVLVEKENYTLGAIRR
ncbi:MAG: hypothetical protein WC087_01975 [Candidatus Paceibacterota bacterium]